MIIEKMEGTDRELLIMSIDTLLTRTKAAIGTNIGGFLPTTAAESQVTQLEQAKGSVPLFDSIDRDVEIIEPLIGLCRNALVVQIRVLNKTVRSAEVKQKVPTRESDARMEQLHKILRTLGDERDLETILARAKSDDDEDATDPAQIDFTTTAEGQG